MQRLCVQGESGQLYEICPGHIYRIDGLGRRAAETCWEALGNFPHVDEFWAMSLALRFDEERVKREFPWVRTE